MSYCVNCGVELDDSAKKCALCGVAVINPALQTKEQEEKTPFSKVEHIPASVSHRFISYIVTVVLLIPNIVCFLANAVILKGSFWSFYVNATSLLVWTVFVFPFFTKKLKPYLMWFLDTVASVFYVYFFFAMGHEKENTGWFYNGALPIILTTSVMVLVYMFWVKKKKRHWLLKTIAFIGDVAIAALVFGAVIDYSTAFNLAADIGLIVFVSCVVLIAFLIYCYKSKSMRKWLSKNFFV